MALVEEKMLFSSPGVLEKVSGPDPYKKPIYDVLYAEYSGDNDEVQTGLYITGPGTFFYPTDLELINVDEEKGTIGFNSYDGTYLVRKFNETDISLFTDFDLPLTTEMMEEIMAKDAEVGVDQMVEALVNEDTRVVEAIVYTIPDLGVFFRKESKWVPSDPQAAAEYDGAEIIDIDYAKATDLVEKWDAGEISSDEDLQDYAMSEEEEAE
jgi:hypothetical protein